MADIDAAEIQRLRAMAENPDYAASMATRLLEALPALLDALEGARVCPSCGTLTRPCEEWHGPVDIARERDELRAAVEQISKLDTREWWSGVATVAVHIARDALAKLPARSR